MARFNKKDSARKALSLLARLESERIRAEEKARREEVIQMEKLIKSRAWFDGGDE